MPGVLRTSPQGVETRRDEGPPFGSTESGLVFFFLRCSVEVNPKVDRSKWRPKAGLRASDVVVVVDSETVLEHNPF